MKRYALPITLVLALGSFASTCLPAASAAGEVPESAVRGRVRGLESLGRARDEAALRSFIEANLTARLASSLEEQELMSMLRTIGEAAAGAGEITISESDGGLVLSLRGVSDLDVRFTLEGGEPYRIDALSIERPAGGSGRPGGAATAPIAWDDLAERLDEEAAAGFSGCVLVVRDGSVVLHEGYGMADEERGIPNTIETVFCIGSTAIDFTRAAVLMLMDEGKLDLSDPVSRFFPQAPPDKGAITIEQLMTGRSGLPNFHHDPATDTDYDLTWIDRKEALRRIFAAPLLFAPGEGRAHSHSAFVLLAAVVEVASGDPYTEFVRERLLEPIGLDHTGFYGRDPRLDPDLMAVGYGPSSVGEPNIPGNWGPASWLVMGSGGMVSNPGDIYRWVRAIHSGEYLSGRALEVYGRGNVLAGGSDRGFLFVYIDDPLNTILVSSNVHGGPGDRADAVARALVNLVASSTDGGEEREEE